MKRIFLIGILTVFIFNVFAQDKAAEKWELKDAVFNYKKFIGERISNVQFIPGKKEFSRIDYQKRSIEIYSSKNGKIIRSISLQSLKKMVSSLVDTNSFRFPVGLEWVDKNQITFWKQDTLLELNLQKGKVIILFALPEKVTKKFLSPKKSYLVFVKDNNLFMMNRDGKIRQITSDGNENIQYGSDVHRREFGISSSDGVFWSPDEKMFAFYRKDESMVTDYPYLDYLSRPMKVQLKKYPMAGMKNHQVKLGIYDLKTGEIVYLNTGEEPDVYLTCVSWTNDSRYLLLARVNRDQNHVDVMRFDSKNKWQPKILFSVDDEEWTEPYSSIHPLKSSPSLFIWHFYKNGYRNLMLFDINGHLVQDITNFSFDVTTYYGEDKRGEYIFFQATGPNPLNRRLYRYHLKTKKLVQLTSNEGTYELMLNPFGRHHLVSFTSMRVPFMLYYAPDGKPKSVIFKAKNPFEGIDAPVSKLVSLKSDDGCTLYGLLITPQDIPADAKLPVLVYVYGGPHSQLVRNTWLGFPNPWLYYMAQRGYVVWVMDNHGTFNRGEHFEQAIFRNLGTIELKDQLKGLEYVRSLSFVDTSRIGVHGWSYGGFMTLTLMSRATRYFKTAVAGAPVVDWKYYETVYTERYMDTPEQNPDGYAKASILNHIQDVKGHLLVVQGTSDDIVVWQHTILLVNEAIKKGVQMDYFIFPGHKHGIRGKDRFYLYQKMTDYFDHWLNNKQE